jgi:hypothetical protein
MWSNFFSASNVASKQQKSGIHSSPAVSILASGMSSFYTGMVPAPYTVVVERKTGGKVRAQRKAFSRTTVIALSLIGIAALCHKYTYRGNYQDLADAPAKADGGMDEVAVKAIEVDMKKEEKKVETGLKENWVSPPPCPPQKFIVVCPARRGGGGSPRGRHHRNPRCGGGWAALRVSIEPSHTCV